MSSKVVPGKFGALGKLNSIRPEIEETRKQGNKETANLEIEEPWEALGTEIRKITKRRLKAYAGANGGKLKELVDQAIARYLDSLEN